jgi:hypothetical protein
MPSCQEVDALMTPYVDGEAAAAEVAAVEAHVDQCPACRERASFERTARHVLKARASVLGEQASAGLRARCVAATPAAGNVGNRDAAVGWTGWAVGWVPLSMAATLVLAVGGVFFFGQNQRLEAAFAAQLAIDHDRCFMYLENVAPGFDEEQAVRRASGFGLEVAVPRESGEFDLVDVRQCLYDEGKMVHVLCEWQGQPVSLFVVPNHSCREQVFEIVDHNAVTWSKDENAYVLVADQGPVEIGDVAAYVREHTD